MTTGPDELAAIVQAVQDRLLGPREVWCLLWDIGNCGFGVSVHATEESAKAALVVELQDYDPETYRGKDAAAAIAQIENGSGLSAQIGDDDYYYIERKWITP